MRVRIARIVSVCVAAFAGHFLASHGYIVLGVGVASAGFVLSILALP